MVETTRWEQCYSTAWPKELLTPESWAHPAKFSYNLIQRIYAHAKEEGWIYPGARVIDPFGGVALGALEALRYGCSWTGVELEVRFFGIAEANLAKWMHEYRHLPGWGPWAMVVNGDSRKLLAHMPAQAGCVVSSPPYAGSQQVDNRATKPTTMSSTWRKHFGEITDGNTPGQLANMAVSSPPYADGCAQQGHDYHPERMVGTRTGYLQRGNAGYGTSAGQMADMVASSPPFMSTTCRGAEDPRYAHKFAGPQKYSDERPVDPRGTVGGDRNSAQVKAAREARAAQVQNLGEMVVDSGATGPQHAETFWEAARLVVSQTYALLRPGAHAIWVVKSYVREKKIVDFPGQWQAMCESVGFVTLHIHHAMLVEEHGTQETLFGEATTYQTEKKSFFRRLAEKKGSPRIDYEVVLCMQK